MLTRTQMENLTGVSRRMLQDYNELGLLKCREKTPGGYWLYAEEDLDRLAIIQTLRHFGFSRSRIKELLTNADATPTELISSAEAALLEQRDQIDRLLRTLRVLRLQSDFPQDIGLAGFRLLIEGLRKDCNLQDVLNSSVPDEEELADPRLHTTLLLTGHIMLLSSQRHLPADAPEVQRNVARLCSFLRQEYEMEQEEIIMLIETITAEPEFDRQTAPGSGAFLLRCVRHYYACNERADGTPPPAGSDDKQGGTTHEQKGDP